MILLVYCITGAPPVGGPPWTGVGGKTVSFIGTDGLCAAVSEMDSEETAPSISKLLEYSRVVDAMWRLQAVIPMRYGCFLDGISAIHATLEEKNPEYKVLLQGLQGRVEMGIRILFPEPAAASTPGTQVTDRSQDLSMRRSLYLMQDENSHRHQVVLETYIQAFSELQCRFWIETASSGGSVVLSTYFLVHKDKVSRFREIYARVTGNVVSKTLISGPLPPYNFAASDLHAYAGQIAAEGRNHR